MAWLHEKLGNRKTQVTNHETEPNRNSKSERERVEAREFSVVCVSVVVLKVVCSVVV